MSEKAEREYEYGRVRLERRINTLRNELRSAERELVRYEAQRESRIWFIDKIDEIMSGPVT